MSWAVPQSCSLSLQGSGGDGSPRTGSNSRSVPRSVRSRGKLCSCCCQCTATARGWRLHLPESCWGGCERSPSVITQLRFLGLLAFLPHPRAHGAGIAVGTAAGPGASAQAPSKHNKSLDHQPQKSLLIKGFRDGYSKSRRDPVEAGQCKHLGKRLGFQMSSPHKP